MKPAARIGERQAIIALIMKKICWSMRVNYACEHQQCDLFADLIIDIEEGNHLG